MIKKRTIMGMPVTINIAEKKAKEEDINEIFSYLHYMDEKFSPYKSGSEVSKINRREIREADYSREMKQILRLSDETKKETFGYFDVYYKGHFDPSGIVKGYAIYKSSEILRKRGYGNFYVEIAGDIEVRGKNGQEPWKVGIQNPFNLKEIVKILFLSNRGIATSGAYRRGLHIYDPLSKDTADEIASITVIGKNVFEADRLATAAFAMGNRGINFLENLKGVEAYMIRKDRKAVFTSGFKNYIKDIN